MLLKDVVLERDDSNLKLEFIKNLEVLNLGSYQRLIKIAQIENYLNTHKQSVIQIKTNDKNISFYSKVLPTYKKK